MKLQKTENSRLKVSTESIYHKKYLKVTILIIKKYKYGKLKF